MIKDIKKAFADLVHSHSLKGESIAITARPLSVREAIGETDRDNLPLQKGEEVLIQAEFRGCSGQAFTDHPGDFNGTLDDLLNLDLKNNFETALLVAAINAVTCHLGLVTHTVHCRNDDLEKCGQDIARELINTYGRNSQIGVIGFQPVIIEHLIDVFGQKNVRVSDLKDENIGTNISGVEIWDGSRYTEKLIAKTDVVLATGSTVANNSLEGIVKAAQAHNTELLLYGTTIAGPAELLGLKRICPKSY